MSEVFSSPPSTEPDLGQTGSGETGPGETESTRWLWVTFWTVAVVSVILDQASKEAALRFLSPASPVWIVRDLFSLHLTFNPGAAFSLFEGGRWVFVAVSIAAMFFLPAYLRGLIRGGDTHGGYALGLGLILGGAIGNAIDRLFRLDGYVIDFFHAEWRDHHFPVFNVADSGISVGVTLVIAVMVFSAPARPAVTSTDPVEAD